MTENTRGCCGKCCERFSIPKSPREIEEEVMRNRAFGYRDDDLEIVYGMLIYLGRNKLNGNHKYDAHELHWYTCRHFDKKTRLCSIYEKRPTMCRRYGETRPCEYDGCHKEPAMPTASKKIISDSLLKEMADDMVLETPKSKRTQKEEAEKKIASLEYELLHKGIRLNQLELQVTMLEQEKALWVKRATDQALELERALGFHSLK